MSTELIIDTSDKLTVRNTVDYVEVGSADVIKISQLDSTEVGANDSLIVTPYQSATSIDYKIPQSVTQGILDVAAIREDLLLKLADLDVAINYAKAYKDEVEESVRTQVFSEMDVRYLSNSSSNTATTDFIKAQVLATDLSNMVVVTSTDTNGEVTSTATLGELKDRYLEVGNSLSGFTSQLNANTTASSAAVTATQVLTAKVEDVEARLHTEEGVSVGQFSTFMIDGVLQPKPNAGRNWLESELAVGMIKLVSGVQYQYLGGALGGGSNGWVRTDASASAETNRVVNATSGTFVARPATANPKDIYVCTDRWYSSATAAATSYVTADPSTTVAKEQFGPVVYEYSTTGWVGLANGTAVAVKWAGGASKLLHGPDGAITGWSFGDGSNTQSQFKIKADKFYLEAAGSSTKQSTYVPFSVDATSGEINFNGKVTFGSVTGTPTHTTGTGEPTGTPVAGSTYTKTSTTPATVYIYNGGWKVTGTPGALTAADVGDLAMLDTIGLAKLDSTIVDGGYLKTSLIRTGIIYSSNWNGTTGMKIDLDAGSIYIA